MAFTLAHMAAALPFYRNNNKSHSRRWLQFDALLIGTMIPDLPYYTGGSSAIGDLSHQWVGVLTYCLPSGILVFALWYWVLKPAVYALIQPFLKKATGDRFNEDRYKGQRRIIGYADKHWSFARLKKWHYAWFKLILFAGNIWTNIWCCYPSGLGWFYSC